MQKTGEPGQSEKTNGLAAENSNERLEVRMTNRNDVLFLSKTRNDFFLEVCSPKPEVIKWLVSLGNDGRPTTMDDVSRSFSINKSEFAKFVEKVENSESQMISEMLLLREEPDNPGQQA